MRRSTIEFPLLSNVDARKPTISPIPKLELELPTLNLFVKAPTIAIGAQSLDNSLAVAFDASPEDGKVEVTTFHFLLTTRASSTALIPTLNRVS